MTSGLPSATMKSAYSATLGAQGGTAPYTWRVNAGSLPAGLSLSSNGSISGTPLQTGTTSFAVLVTDSSSAPQTSTQSLSINVATSQGSPVITLSISTTGVVNGISTQQYSGSVSASGGTAPYTFSVTAGSLPAGLSLNSSTGAISGTPAVPGTFPFTVQATDSGQTQQTAAGAASVLIVAPLQITTTSLPPMQAQSAVNTTINIAGGMAPYVFSVSNGTLPTGLSLNSSTGALSGMPSASGAYRFTVQVNDPPALPQTASQIFSGSVTAGASALQVNSSTMPTGQVGSTYSASLSATGGTQPYTWSVYSGSLNPGLSLSSGGQITGTPTAGGTDTFTVQVTDANSLTATGSVSVPVGASLSITTTSLPVGTQGTAFNSSLAATGGTTPYSWSVTSGSLPAGLTLATNGSISGSPSATGTFAFGVKVTDASSNTATQNLSIIVSSSAPGNPPSTATDTLTIYEVDGVSQNARPVTFGRVFTQGEITQCPQPTVDGGTASAWQADVKNRWPDGSVKFAVISLITPLNAAGSATVGFQNSSSCNNNGFISTSSSPSFAGFNGGNWDAQIKVSAAGSTSVTTSAKSMLAASDPSSNAYGDCKNDYWLQGPVVTAVIVQDCTASMSADFGWTWNGSTMSNPVTGTASTASFHPMFILYFYPSISAVECEEIIENDWTGKNQDQLADFLFATDDPSGALQTRWSHTGARVISGVNVATTILANPAVSTATLTVPSANFTASDVGLAACLTTSSYGTPVCGPIQSVASSTVAVMELPTGASSFTLSNQNLYMNLQSAMTRHRKTFWSGTAPGHIRIDFNFPYLISTGALPNYDLVNASINPHNGYYPSGKCCDYGWDGWIQTDRGEIGGYSGIIGSYAGVLEGAPLQRADLAFLYNMGTCGQSNGYCAVAWQQLTGGSAIGDSGLHAGLDTSAVTQYDVAGGGGQWDVLGAVPYHLRESRTSPSSDRNGLNLGSVNCFYVSQMENKNATTGTFVTPATFGACLGGGDGNVADPTGPNNATGKAFSTMTHGDGAGSAPPGNVGSSMNPPYSWDLGEASYHWLDYAYLPYLLTGSPYYLENEYQSGAFQAYGSTYSGEAMNVTNSGYIYRKYAWVMQTFSRNAFIAPDGSAEQAYWNTMFNSSLEFVEGALGITGTTLTPSSSQGSFATSGTITNYNIHAANRWDFGRYTAISGNTSGCQTTGSGSCPVIPSGLHQWTQGFCNNAVGDGPFATFNPATASAAVQYWMYWYIVVTLGEARDMGFSQAASVHNATEQFLEGMTLSPTNNPWYGLAAYESPITSGNASTCTTDPGSYLPFYTRYGTSTGFFGGWSTAFGNPTTTTQQNNFGDSSYKPSGGLPTGNIPCADHGYSLLARAAGTFLPKYGINEADADGTYTPMNAWSWLNTNIPYWGNSPAQALPLDCPLAYSYDVTIKWSLTPR